VQLSHSLVSVLCGVVPVSESRWTDGEVACFRSFDVVRGQLSPVFPQLVISDVEEGSWGPGFERHRSG
jgi:hypothetical protein